MRSLVLLLAGVATALPFAGAFAQSESVHHRHHHRAATAGAAGAATGGAATATTGTQALPDDSIVAVVNGSAITASDVANREKLFALSTGMRLDPAAEARLRPQIASQLIDEKLRMQEMQRRKIVVTPDQIAHAIAGIESRNGMPAHALEDRLAADGVSQQTLIDQIRVQIGWTDVLRGDLGPRARVTAQEISARENLLKQEAGRPEYNVSEIFIPVDDPTRSADSERFAETVIGQLRQGAPFPIVAAQFGQSQSALDGGALGWVQADRLDPEVVDVLNQMPVGAISNPIRVAGGYTIVTLHGKRTVGNQMTTVLAVREAFYPFATKLDPQNPTAQQKAQLVAAQGALNKPCDTLEALNKAQGEVRPSDPGQLVLSDINPQMAGVLAPVPVGGTTKPLISTEGIAVIGVCSKTEKNLADQSPRQIADSLIDERVDLASRQENRDLHRRAVIDDRSS